jgi:hypothetical protein
MGTPVLCVVTFAAFVVACSEKVEGQFPRVRSEDRTITSLIAQASQLSTTFRGILDEIESSDGIVHITHGRCRHGGAACMAMTVTPAGPYRLLRIIVDPRKADCDLDLMASLGHELWHTLEVLREPSLRTYAEVYHFYARDGRHTDRTGTFGGWETPAARKAGDAVFRELRDHLAEQPGICAPK